MLSPAHVRFLKSRETLFFVELDMAATKPGTRRKGTPSGDVIVFVDELHEAPDCAASIVMFVDHQSAPPAAEKYGRRSSM